MVVADARLWWKADVAATPCWAYVLRMTVHRYTKVAAAIIIATSWGLLLLLHFHVVEWGQAG